MVVARSVQQCVLYIFKCGAYGGTMFELDDISNGARPSHGNPSRLWGVVWIKAWDDENTTALNVGNNNGIYAIIR